MGASPQASAAMVAAQIIKSGDGAKGWKDKCKLILAEIKGLDYGTYAEVTARRQEQNNAAKAAGETPPRAGEQSEHMVPNSCCTEGSGRHGDPVSGLGNYTEGNGFAYSVEDDQRVGTEHKFLTNQAREASRANSASGTQETLSQWLDKGEKNAEDMFNGKRHDADGNVVQGESLVRDRKGRTEADKKKIAKAAAKCLRLLAEENFRKNGAKGDPVLNNGFHKGVKGPSAGSGPTGGGAA
jgi:hypothetical protein